ncbi:MAG: GumC family protein [Bacteroidota bacterium]
MERIDEIINLIDTHEKKETRNTFLKYLKKWPWFVVFCLIGLGLGYFYYKNSPTTYRVSSRLLIENRDDDINAFNERSSQYMAQKINIENQIGILHSYTLYSRALANLNWDYSWYQKKLLYNQELYNNPPFELVVPPNAMNAENLMVEIEPINDKEYVLRANGKTDMNGYTQEVEFEETLIFGDTVVNDFFHFAINNGYGKPGETYLLNFNSLHALTSRYLGRTIVEPADDNSDLITIAIEGSVPQKDADFINELNNVYIQFGMENENRNSEQSMEFINDQLARIERDLSMSEEKFSNYRQNNQAVNLGEEAQLVYQKLEEIENEQYQTQLQLDYYRDLDRYLHDSQKMEDMVNPSVVNITDQNLTATLNKLSDLYSRREELSYSVTESNPKLVRLNNEIRVTRDALEETVKSQLQVVEDKMASLNRRYNEAQARLGNLPQTEKEVVSLQREFDLNNELYTYMLQKKAESDIAKASVAPKVQIIDPALAQSAAFTGPSLVKYTGIGFFAGFFLTFATITLISFFNTKIESREEIERWSKLPVLEGIVKHKYKGDLPVVNHPRSGIAESFRGLKSNLNAILEQPGARVVSVNSLVPGEGKSFISSNFSAILTKTNTKVLLIGADMHKPTLHKFLNQKEGEGLSNYLRGEKEMEDIVMSTSIPNLKMIQAGPIPKNPSDLIESSKFELLLERARKMFDYVIIDNAPLLLVPDAILTSRYSDVSLFVLRIDLSHKEQIKQINKMVEFNKIKKAAIVVNGSPDRGYGYGKKYWKKGYGEYKQKMSIA